MGPAVDQLKQVNLQALVSWVMAGLVSVTLTLVWSEMVDLKLTVKEISDRQINHEIMHPSHEIKLELERHRGQIETLQKQVTPL